MITDPDVQSERRAKILGALLRLSIDDGMPTGSALPACVGMSNDSSRLRKIVLACCDLEGEEGRAAKELLVLDEKRPTRKAVESRRKLFAEKLGLPRYSAPIERAVCEKIGARLAAEIAVAVVDPTISNPDSRPAATVPIRKIGSWLWTFAGINLLALIGTVTGIMGVWPDPPRRLDGEVNVAIAAEDVSGEQLEDQLYSLASSVARRIQNEVGGAPSGTDVQVLFPNETDLVKLDGEASEEALRELSRRHNADIVVLVRSGSDDLTAATTVFVDARAVEGAEELAGSYIFGSDVLLGGNSRAAVGGSVRERIANRADALVNFVAGIGSLQRREFLAAQTLFQATISEVETTEVSVLSVAYLFLGNTFSELAARSGDDAGRYLDSAAEAYSDGLELGLGSPRLQLGALQILYARAQGGCRPASVDAASIMAVSEELDDLRDQSNGPAILLARIDLTLGRVRLCEYLAGLNDDRAEIVGLLNGIIRRAEQSERPLREIAAEAHMDMGLLLSSRTPSAIDLAVAREHYEQAGALAVDPFRRAVASFQAGFLAAQSGDLDDAQNLLVVAIEQAELAAYPLLADRARVVLQQLEP